MAYCVESMAMDWAVAGSVTDNKLVNNITPKIASVYLVDIHTIAYNQ